MTIKLLKISRSTNPEKKMMAVFEVDGRERTTHFGQAGAKDYTTHDKMNREARKKSYDARHRPTEDWSDPTSAGALSKYILWNKTSLSASIADYKRRFGF
jgi:hypothetical protein